ncbi:PHP domain-containing protein [Candidatus Vampirococcus lugosii]|uniref:DNA polymerase III subunit alpha n=1 Tax=Candidatus Vampirococcus lugosii TaxID=2789015 RepID=A0ABS5QKA7_9BACT|nr:PHP domain-containing protein [Candidatus Vampirococcus lugosii]MBS8121623.1 DNA polymerase III subunit alpha [Candidatus Vampirococcus lugosii]
MIHLHGHSHYSLLEAVGNPSKIVNKAKELNMESIAITDYYGMYGIIEFYQIAKKSGIKPVIGVEINFTEDFDRSGSDGFTSLVLLAKNNEGYQNLMKLVSYANINGFINTPSVDLKGIKKYNEGLIAFFGGEESQIGKMILNNENDDFIKDKIKYWKDIFGNDNFLLEIIAQDESKNKYLKIVNNKIVEIANITNTKMIVNNNFCYIEKSDKDAYEALISIKDSKAYQAGNIKGDFHIMSKEEIENILQKNGYTDEIIKNLINNNIQISQNLNVEMDLGKILFPNYESDDNIKDLYESLKDILVEKN